MAGEGEAPARLEPHCYPLEGLADDFESDSSIRKTTLRTKALLTWVAPNKVGVVTNKSLKLNAPILEVVLRKWCPVAPNRKTVPVGYLKKEVGNLLG